MSNKFRGVIHTIEDTVELGEKKFKKRGFVITDNDARFPNFLPFEFTGDKVSLLDKFSKGDEVVVDFNIKGRLWTNPRTEKEQCFVSLSAWRIVPAAAVESDTAETSAEDDEEISVADDSAADDLPF